jgi:catechol 2,3-dioxygenase-like lactoylglutathione lyase family enzyme
VRPDFLSYGLTVDDFDAKRLSVALAGLGVKDVRVTDRVGTAELFLRDPNGVTIQLQHVRYGHGSGPLGDVLPPAPRDTGAPVFSLQGINHVTLTPNQGAKSLEFYQRVFRLPVKSHQGTTVLLEIGTGPGSIAFNTALNDPGAPAGINHACFTIRNFDPNRVMGVLMDNGMEPIEFGNPALIKPMTCRVRLRQRAANGGGPTSPLGTPELYFNDPDNIAIQLQDVSYCGGSGWLGQICS